ncbi:MAG: amidase [Gammaproteobacteria bacterium]|jgi:amidase|nr:amidase [Gammaproteobacteria bacterium]MBT5204787.1 amidase [Gammaproteobacteria bacterium]MBT5603944.1 amidase [Gammaproteobacteria bacterium]MBT6244582.1 amidase [Gammaproteobacteria bacterium]
MNEFLDQPLQVIAAALKNGETTSVALVTDCLERIDRVNPDLNAVVSMAKDLALKHAAKADADSASGQATGPLHGIPMTIKDSLDTFDMITTWGTQGRQQFRPGKDAACVARLRRAGAILVGKTNTPEFTLSFQTDNLLFGRTNNPFDLNRSSGGSSGGAAALIASGAIPFDIGTDTGGSIRLPAHFCGISGIKPTTGRVPCTGNALPAFGLIAPLTQPGPLARYVDDLTLLLSIIAGPDFIDPHCIDAPWYDPKQVNLEQLRIGYHSDNGLSSPEPAIIASINEVVELLEGTGFNVTPGTPNGVEMASLIMTRLMAADDQDLLITLLEESRTSEPSSKIQNNLDRGKIGMTAVEVAQTINVWHSYQSSMLSYFNDHDLLICPVNAHTAILHEQQENMLDYSYTMAYNLTGWPSVVIRAGTDETGLPIGIQILAAPFREDRCLAMASFLEDKLGSFSLPDIYSGAHSEI